jgi:hypothetical protein
MSSDWREVHSRARRFVASLPKAVLRPAAALPGEFGDDILPFDLYENTRQNIERIADQINKCYYFGVFDGCAVLMRRLIEMLLVLAFKEHGRQDRIRGTDGNYVHLSQIIAVAVEDVELDLSRNAKRHLGTFRTKGDLSAHGLFHNARKGDIDRDQAEFRQLVEELLYKAGIFG